MTTRGTASKMTVASSIELYVTVKLDTKGPANTSIKCDKYWLKTYTYYPDIVDFFFIKNDTRWQNFFKKKNWFDLKRLFYVDGL